jgi:putative hydrolase of the HAD superfamily
MNKNSFDENRIKAVFFDAYGTLFIYDNMENAWKDWIKTFYEKLKKYGLKMNLEEFRQKTDGFFSRPEPTQTTNGLSIFQCRVKRYSEKLGLNLNNSQIKEISEACLNAWQKYVLLDQNVIPLFKRIKKSKKLALISNFDHPPHLHNILKKSKIFNMFDHIVISGEVGVKKPNPEIFNFALEELGLKPEEVIYIGDAPEDVQAAHSANIFPVVIKRKNLEHYSLHTDYKTKGYSRTIEIPQYKKVLKICSLKELYELFP